MLSLEHETDLVRSCIFYSAYADICMFISHYGGFERLNNWPKVNEAERVMTLFDSVCIQRLSELKTDSLHAEGCLILAVWVGTSEAYDPVRDCSSVYARSCYQCSCFWECYGKVSGMSIRRVLFR